MEEWRKIPGFEKYEVSSEGCVRGGRWGHSLSSAPDKDGYLRLGLYNADKKQKNLLVHRLVALAFIPNPFNEKEIDHKDGNKRNNSVGNLEWSNRNKNKTNPNTPQPLGISNERFIIKRYNDTYMVCVNRQNFRYCKHFKNLPEAIDARDTILVTLTSLRH